MGLFCYQYLNFALIFISTARPLKQVVQTMETRTHSLSMYSLTSLASFSSSGWSWTNTSAPSSALGLGCVGDEGG